MHWRICRVVPGGRTGARRRAGGAHGRRAYSKAVSRRHRGSPADGFQPALHTARDVGGNDPEAQHGASGIDLPRASNGRRGGRRHGDVSLADCSRRSSRHCVLVGRPTRGVGLGPSECHECSIQVATALGIGVLVCPRHPATGFGNLVGPGGQRESGPAGSLASGQVQSGGAQGEYSAAMERK